MNFWATWCPPCIKEIPQLLKIKEKYYNNINLVFVTMDLNVDAVIPKFLKKYKFKKMKMYKHTPASARPIISQRDTRQNIERF